MKYLQNLDALDKVIIGILVISAGLKLGVAFTGQDVFQNLLSALDKLIIAGFIYIVVQWRHRYNALRRLQEATMAELESANHLVRYYTSQQNG